MTLATLLPELPACKGGRRAAWKTLQRGIKELLDGNGLPRAEHAELLRALTACWIRAAWLDQHRLDCRVDQLPGKQARLVGERALSNLDRDSRLQLEWAVREVIRSSRWDGSAIFGQELKGQKAELNELITAALAVTRDKEDIHAAAMLLNTPTKSLGASKPKGGLIGTSEYSEWAELAVMRCGWRPSDPLLAVKSGGQETILDLSFGKQRLLQGPWEVQMRCDDASLQPPADHEFEEVCWFSDEDCDYLELELELADGFKLQRQMLLGRQDRFLYLADAVISDGQSGRLSYEASIPLAGDGWRWAPADQTREGELVSDGVKALVLPLYQPEWRSERLDGGLTVGDGKLLWSLEADGSALYSGDLAESGSAAGWQTSHMATADCRPPATYLLR